MGQGLARLRGLPARRTPLPPGGLPARRAPALGGLTAPGRAPGRAGTPPHTHTREGSRKSGQQPPPPGLTAPGRAPGTASASGPSHPARRRGLRAGPVRSGPTRTRRPEGSVPGSSSAPSGFCFRIQLGALRVLFQDPAPAPECGAWGCSPHKTALHKAAAWFQSGGWEAEGASRDSDWDTRGAGAQQHSADTHEAVLSQGLPSFCGHRTSETPVKVLERSSQTGTWVQPTKPPKAHGCRKGDRIPIRNVPCSPPPSWRHFSLSGFLNSNKRLE